MPPPTPPTVPLADMPHGRPPRARCPTQSLLAGLTVFAYLGHLSKLRGVPVAQVVVGGTSLAFEVFPLAFATLPAPALWAFAFLYAAAAAAITRTHAASHCRRSHAYHVCIGMRVNGKD